MDEEISWALPDDEDERGETSSPPAARPLGPPPSSREEILGQVGLARLAVYDLVRTSVDEFERVAPWRVLYYPPEDHGKFVGILTSLIELIEGIPKRVAAAMNKVPKGAPTSDDEPTREDIRFMFSGIHHMVAHELKRIEATLAPVRERGSATADERQLLCELSADLKGKYASSMMGAAASLIAQGLWNGVEVEPVLFPEKADEFRGTRELVDLLKEVSEAIKQLPEQVHFKELMQGWQDGHRVDQYALADLPSLRGKIAKLLKERTRRSLYSGDYHQISRREILLSERINEMETLHQRTWSTDHGGQDLAPTFARLVQLTLEMACVLDVTILKDLIGDKKVEGLRARVTSARTRPVSTASNPGAGLDSLIPLLAEDDLRIFLELLLGAVMRRASLTVTMREPEPAPAPPPPPPPPPVQAAPPPPPPPPPAPPAPTSPMIAVVEPAPPGALLPDIAAMDDWTLPPPKPAADWTTTPQWTPDPEPPPPVDTWKPEPSWGTPTASSWQPEPEPTADSWLTAAPSVLDWAQPEPDPEPPRPAAPAVNKRQALKTVSGVLNELLGAGNSNLNSFKMAQRMLSKHNRIPAAMLESTHPFIRDVQERLVPHLRQITPFQGITDEAVKKLEGYCTDLRRKELSPAQLKDEIPKKMERFLRFLEALRAAVPPL